MPIYVDEVRDSVIRIQDAENPFKEIDEIVSYWAKRLTPTELSDHISTLQSMLRTKGLPKEAIYVCYTYYSKETGWGIHKLPDTEPGQPCSAQADHHEIISLKFKTHTQESQLRLYQDTKNNELNCSVLAMFLMHYLQSKEKKSLAQREAAKNSVIDIISELRTQPYLPNGLLDYISDFDDETVPQYHANTIVMNQHNDHYVGIVEQGGTGVNINQNDLSLWKQKRK